MTIKKTKQKSQGFSLLETMLVLTVLALAGVGVYKMFSPSSTQAAIKQEQGRVETMVDGVFNAYTTASDFSTISTQTVSGILGMPLNADNQSLKTAFNTVSATIRPATTTSTNDSFDLVYTGPTSKECVGLVKAISPLSNAVFIGSNANIQAADGKINNETNISTFCNQTATSALTFRFVGQKHTFAATSMNSCICAPTTETQNIACPTGSSGTITQRRTGLCTGGTPACPSLAWSSWATILNTCAVDGSTVTPTGPAVVVPPDTCIPSVETQTVACPVGQVGGILQQRSRLCPSNTWSSWMQVSSSCQVDTTRNTCTPRTVQSSRACPSGQGGQETVEQTSVCDTNGNETWGPVKLIGSTCTASCVSTGTCCVVGSRTQTQDRLCGDGAYGKLLVQQKQSSTCSTATATPVWPSTWIDIQTTGTCTSCPAPVTESQTQDVASSAACPLGQTGSHRWTSRQVRTRTMSYNCPNGTTALPSPTYSAWSSWTETSRLNETNTCAASSCITQDPIGYSDGNGGNGGYSYNYTLASGGENVSCSEQSGDDCDAVARAGDAAFKVWETTCQPGDTFQTWDSPIGYSPSDQITERTTMYRCGSCNVVCVPPAPSAIAISRSVANENQTVACPAGQTGSITQTRARTENGTRTTSWTCPGPTSSATDSWSGTFNYGAWTTVSNTCVASASCIIRTDWQTGTMDVSDAFFSISYTANGVGGGCRASLRDDGRNAGYNCREGANGVLSLSQWQQQAQDGETYYISGSQSGWEGQMGDFWGWDDFTYVKRSGAACLPSTGNFSVINESCATETHYNVPTLQQQANAACVGQSIGFEPATIHHFPSYQVGCYALVKCE